MNTVCRTTTLCCLFCTITLLFTSCHTDHAQAVTKFYSSVEKNNKRHTEALLQEVEDSNLKGVLVSIYENKVSVHDKYIKRSIKSISDRSPHHTKILSIEHQLARLDHDQLYHDTIPSSIDSLEKMLQQLPSPLSEYYLARLMHLKAQHLIHHSYYQYAAATAMYGRHLLDQIGGAADYPKTEIHLLETLALSLQEDYTKEEQATMAFMLALTLADTYHYPAAQQRLEVAIASEGGQNTSDLPSLWREAASDSVRAALVGEYLYVQPTHEVIKHLDAIEKAMVYEKNPRNMVINYGYLIDHCIKTDFDRALRYARLAAEIRSPAYLDQKWMDYYNAEVRVQLHQAKYHRTGDAAEIDSAISASIAYINMAVDLLPDLDDSHIDDLAMEQAVDLGSILALRADISLEEASLFFHLVERAQAQELKKLTTRIRQDNGRLITQSDSINVRIAQIEQGINDYHRLTDASPHSYAMLYHLYGQRVRATHDATRRTLDIPLLQERLGTYSSAYVGYLSYPTEQVICYMIDAQGIHLKSIDWHTMDSLVQHTLTSLRDMDQTIVPATRDFLLPFDLSAYERIFLTTDGPMSRFPPAMLSNGRQQIVQVTGPSQILAISEDMIHLQKSVLFNLSSETTIKDKQKVQLESELPLALKACRKIHSILGLREDALITGDQMTAEAITHAFHEDIVHISTHGFTDDDIVNQNSILVRKAGQMIHLNCTALDGLAAYPTFIYLDGCNTGSGVNQIGEGTYSLARIFAKNGAETIIKTLWPIDEASSSDFAVRFYQYWHKGATVGEAFHSAQADIRSQYGIPYHWAPYVLYGNPLLRLQ